ncbi:hypothetical protein H4684_003690 [Desulfomicrobium macestii]|uniref:Uncharacterized protein n=1 Tax=Desulfomicrobium macestii TaxID=90731 RepID=A0ABR9H8F1_9BACT|nr:hypothetical protein [Desulfomicrobium macestii]MBE1427006.1 hypothetical protein [Desulfomicrobium macestii]
MFDINGKYQASIFGNFTDISPNSENIIKILSLFKEENYIPSTIQEISQIASGNAHRVQLITNDREWHINFLTNRIDIEKNPIDSKGNNLGKIEDFTNYSVKTFEKILLEFNKKSSRFSLVTSGLLKEISSEKLDCIYCKLFNQIKFYEDNPPFEWNFRTVSKIKKELLGSQENYNIISSINRLQGIFSSQSESYNFDRIEVQFDINTTHENQETRFELKHIDEFMKQAVSIRADLIEEFKEYLDV